MSRSQYPFSLTQDTVNEIEEKFARKKQLAAARDQDLFAILDEGVTEEEALALKFLYAYMPLNDLADYNGSMFLNHVRATLSTRQQTPWGKQVPDHSFLHFVLPYRVNNENIDDIRGWLFDELYPRVQGMSMTNAVLETNHWCHEKANYIGNDTRTVSPLTLIRTALGRCGEQSSLAVAALRSLGIPARQCYTPRWAHCDSNHAWVEAWTDGEWHFLGACEPEPSLDQGWFRKPARRAMLVHTRVPSRYTGEEKVTFAKPWLSELNLLDHYAPNKTINVQITDESGQPAQAKVDFQVYNYAELSTIVSLDTDEQGIVSIALGLGDVWIHASGNKGFGFAKISVGSSAHVTIILSSPMNEGTMEVDMVPPLELPDLHDQTDQEQIDDNQRRIQEGARIRASYEATFIQEPQAVQLAEELSLPASSVWEVLKKARGNSHEIALFLQEQTSAHGQWPLKLLESMRDKDLTDTFRATLEDHLLHALPLKAELDETMFINYVMCPRLYFEMLQPYRAFFQSHISKEQQERFRAAPAALSEWIDSWFETVEEYTFYKGMATPVGSFRLQKGDKLSRDIMFAAIARSLGIPARLEPSDRRPQYWQMGRWYDVSFQAYVAASASHNKQKVEYDKGFIQLIPDSNSEEQAQYHRNFTIARLVNGIYVTLSYEFGKTDVFESPFEVLPGRYRLTTGTRLSDGTTLMHLNFFNLEAGQTVQATVVIRKATADIPVIAKLESAIQLEEMDGTLTNLTEAVQQSVIVLAWIEPDREPSKHLIRELGELSDELNDLNAPIFMLVGEEKRANATAIHAGGNLPERLSLALDDANYTKLSAFTANLPLQSMTRDFPIVAVIDSHMHIRYFSSGYKLGIGRELVNTLKSL